MANRLRNLTFASRRTTLHATSFPLLYPRCQSTYQPFHLDSAVTLQDDVDHSALPKRLWHKLTLFADLAHRALPDKDFGCGASWGSRPAPSPVNKPISTDTGKRFSAISLQDLYALPERTALSRLHGRLNKVPATHASDAHVNDRRPDGLVSKSIRQEPKIDVGHVNSGSQSGSNGQGIFVALGSNLGDRFASIENACRKIDDSPDMQVVKTSGLYETEPMYLEDQDRFLNGICQINTHLEPMDLLDRLQAIENDLGRVKIVDKGPRNIDLDIVAYHDRTIASERLEIPHRGMLEREFVLRPLSDIAASFVHPRTRKELGHHLADLPKTTTPIYSTTPLAPGCSPLRALDPARRTLIMSIMNVTPDSFSDGGINQPADKEALRACAASHIAAGATIIDIGGQSSRPNAINVTAEEELARVLPAIEAIKSLPEAAGVAISVDTYRAQVAEAAINAGAHIINDISAGLLDEDMLPTVARLGCTYIMMHMRGNPQTMQSGENTSYPNGVLQAIAAELTTRLDAAQAAGIRRWRIILDPGVGFSKTTEQNLEILKSLGELREENSALRSYPWLVGSSRKRFIGQITGVESAVERVTGTAATVTAAIAGGAEIVRVHDVKEMAQVVKMADAMYRSPRKQCMS